MSMKSAVAVGVFLILAVGVVLANGGPFVVNYPAGDPAAKGTVAIIDPDLKPARESRLKVVSEDLRVTFCDEKSLLGFGEADSPVVQVTAAYRIENPTDRDINIEFGFPVLRGVYLDPFAMMATPDVHVTIDDGSPTSQEIVSNSAIYGIIRQRCRQVIDNAVASDPQLRTLVKAVKDAEGADRKPARARLAAYLTGKRKWDARDAELMVEYASNRFQGPEDVVVVTSYYGATGSHATWPGNRTPLHMTYSNLGPLRAIGDQKATQFFAQLALRFDPKAARTYESIFEAWGGDVRERSVDLTTGKVRPREYSVTPPTDEELAAHGPAMFSRRGEYPPDPTIYARVDYLDPNAGITDEETESCKNVLKNLNVIFTFAPMNILRYGASFPAGSTRTVTVAYKQYAYADTRDPASYQLVYVVHPASMWDSFGPINLEVLAPEGINVRGSVSLTSAGVEEREVKLQPYMSEAKKGTFAVYKTTLARKTGELYLAVSSGDWRAKYPKSTPPVAAAPVEPKPAPASEANGN